MKLLHISDLHIGKRVHEFSMIEDQKYILEKILEVVDAEEPQGVMIAGDIYDKSVPSGEAVDLFDEFLTALFAKDCSIFMISGNHDSQERLNFGSRIMREQKIHIAGGFSGQLRKEVLYEDENMVNVYLLPFIKPAMVRRYFPEAEINSYEEAICAILEETKMDNDQCNVLVAHQFVTAKGKEPERSESESISIGGVDNIDGSIFEEFDYVALGHIHGPQRMGRDSIRYCGSPLKYSFSEVHHKKSITKIEFHQVEGKLQKTPSISTISLVPLRELRVIKGPISQLLNPEVYTLGNTEDYIWATLTDEETIVDAREKLRCVYPNLMRLTFERDRSRTESGTEDLTVAQRIERNPVELFKEFFETQNERVLTQAQEKILKDVVNKYEAN